MNAFIRLSIKKIADKSHRSGRSDRMRKKHDASTTSCNRSSDTDSNITINRERKTSSSQDYA